MEEVEVGNAGGIAEIVGVKDRAADGGAEDLALLFGGVGNLEGPAEGEAQVVEIALEIPDLDHVVGTDEGLVGGGGGAIAALPRRGHRPVRERGLRQEEPSDHGVRAQEELT